MIKSNTKIGKLNFQYRYRYSGDNEIKTKNPANRYIDFEGSDFASEKSISKVILTNNGRKLKMLLDNLRGYVINNIGTIKANYKNNHQKFKKEDIAQFKKINLNELTSLLQTLSTIDFNKSKLKLQFEISYGYSRLSSNVLKLTLNDHIRAIMKFNEVFKNLAHIKGLVKTKSQMAFLKNYVTDKGFPQSPKDYTKFRGLLTKIGKYSDLINGYKYKGVIDGLNHSMAIEGIPIDKKTIDTLQKCIEGKDVDGQSNLKKLIVKLVQIELPFIKIKGIEIGKIDSIDIEFDIEI